MRKFTAIVCILLLISGTVPAMASEDSLAPTEIQRGTVVTVGTPNAMSGFFSTEMWGNNTADMDVRSLIHGYETVAWTRGAGLSVNSTVITSVETSQTNDDIVRFRLHFSDKLMYNDGSKITAKDYAFYFLLNGAPEITEIGGATQGLQHIIGYDAYRRGETNVLEGVQIISDYVLDIYMSGVYFPYFYSVVLINARPYPISVIAPGCAVSDDGAGCYITGDFTGTLLQETLLNPETGYVFNPQLTCGPYMLESYDSEKKEARFLVNEQFIGNYEGQKPVIERIVFRYEKEDEVVAKIASGELDLMNKIGNPIAANNQFASLGDEDSTGLRRTSYLRTGFTFLAFACEYAPTDSVAVRRAIALSLDKEKLIQENVSSYAIQVDGYYGLGQWMASYVDDGTETGKEPLSVTETLPRFAMAQDLDAAEALLVQDGWTLNGDGQAYVPGQDSVRYKLLNGTLYPLEIRWATTSDHPFAGQLRASLEETLPGLGISLLVDEMDFPTLLRFYYRQTERTYNMFFLASNFNYVFDPFYDFNTADVYQGMANTTGLRDEELMRLAQNMRETESTDLRSYVEKWLLFQARFVDLMPMIPLYSNVYYDIYSSRLNGYDIVNNISWASAILYAYE